MTRTQSLERTNEVLSELDELGAKRKQAMTDFKLGKEQLLTDLRMWRAEVDQMRLDEVSE